jgi:hypothetical protein
MYIVHVLLQNVNNITQKKVGKPSPPNRLASPSLLFFFFFFLQKLDRGCQGILLTEVSSTSEILHLGDYIL